MRRERKGIALAIAALCLTLTGCGDGNKGGDTQDYVRLLAISGADAVGTIEADYYMLAEPAASAQSGKGYSIVGDLQALYGGENGYPQAVLVAKTELVQENAAWLDAFTAKLDGAAEWLQTATGAEVVAAVSAYMDDGTATSLRAPLLTKDVMGRCGVYFTSASESKTEVTTFLQAMMTVKAESTAIPEDGFFYTGAAESTIVAPKGEVRVCMPDGAPALALAKLMKEDTSEDGVRYQVVSANLISSKVTNKDASKNADLCVLPVTAAAKLLGNGNNYQMLGVVTHGNLYLLSKDGDAVTAENISSLKGKTVGVLQMNAVPGLTMKAVLNKYGVAYQEVTSIN